MEDEGIVCCEWVAPYTLIDVSIDLSSIARSDFSMSGEGGRGGERDEQSVSGQVGAI